MEKKFDKNEDVESFLLYNKINIYEQRDTIKYEDSKVVCQTRVLKVVRAQ